MRPKSPDSLVRTALSSSSSPDGICGEKNGACYIKDVGRNDLKPCFSTRLLIGLDIHKWMEKLWLNLCVRRQTYGNHGMGPIQALYCILVYLMANHTANCPQFKHDSPLAPIWGRFLKCKHGLDFGKHLRSCKVLSNVAPLLASSVPLLALLPLLPSSPCCETGHMNAIRGTHCQPFFF